QCITDDVLLMCPFIVVARVLGCWLYIHTPEPMTGLCMLWGMLGLVALPPLVVPLAQWAVRFETPPSGLTGEPGLLRSLVSAALIGGGLLTFTVVGLGTGLATLMGLLAVVAGLSLTRTPDRKRQDALSRASRTGAAV